VLDDEAKLFKFEIEQDPWAAITEPLPESLYDLDAPATQRGPENAPWPDSFRPPPRLT